MLGTETLKTGRPKNKPELKKLTSERIRALQTAQKTINLSRKELDGRRPSKKKEKDKKSHTEERKEPLHEKKAVILSSKRNKTTKKNSWVNKDLTKSPQKKRSEENGTVYNAIKNRTSKNWAGEDLSK